MLPFFLSIFSIYRKWFFVLHSFKEFIMKLDVVLHCKKSGIVYTAYQMQNKYLIHLVKRGVSKWYELYEFASIIMDLEIEVDSENEIIPEFHPVPKDDDPLPF